MNSYRATPPRIDIAAVKATARERMREGDNYRRTALMLGLMMLLVNVPVLLMNYLSTGFKDISALDLGTLQMLNTRMMLFQLLVALLISPAFELSKTRFMLSTMRNGAGSPYDLFDGLSRGSYFVAVRAALWKGLMMYVWLMIPGSIFLQGVLAVLQGSAAGVGGALLGGALMLFITANRGLAYSLQFYLLAEQPRTGAIMSLRLSTLMMHGRLWELFRLNLRLILYILPVMLPNLAALLFLRDSVAFGIAMAVCTIVLSALCLPVVEAAMAQYFLSIKAQLESRAAEMQRAQNSAWPTSPGEGIYGGDDDSTDADDGDAQNESDSAEGDADEPTHEDEVKH